MAIESTPPAKTPTIRPILQTDVEAAARVAFAAHMALAARNGHPSEHPNLSFSTEMIAFKTKDPNAYGFVAERDNQLLGSIFLNVFPLTPIAAIGPLTVDRDCEGAGAGRLLLDRAMQEARTRNISRVRLVQSPSHLRSLALYTKAGFEVREPLVLVTGGLPKTSVVRDVRKAGPDDIDRCEQLCARVHGFARVGEISAAVKRGAAMIALKDGSVSGYSTGLGFLSHAVGETSEDIKALIAAAPINEGPGFFVPVRDGELLRWLLSKGYCFVWQAMLMSYGAYQEPRGAFLPSIAY
jgi:GNAT superfamily N-acetyltransferase